MDLHQAGAVANEATLGWRGASMGNRASPCKYSTAVRLAGSHSGHCDRSFIYCHCGENLHGRATTADKHAATRRRISAVGCNIHWLDLDAVAIGKSGWQIVEILPQIGAQERGRRRFAALDFSGGCRCGARRERVEAAPLILRL
jgi:hypothetical protein